MSNIIYNHRYPHFDRHILSNGRYGDVSLQGRVIRSGEIRDLTDDETNAQEDNEIRDIQTETLRTMMIDAESLQTAANMLARIAGPISPVSRGDVKVLQETIRVIKDAVAGLQIQINS